MALDGTYGFVYCGASGLGIGIFSVKGDQLEGEDHAGIIYRGTAVQDQDENIHLNLTLEVPAGVMLVQGTAPQDVPHTRQLRAIFSPKFGDGQPHEAVFPPGPVTVMVRRISDDYAAALRQNIR